MKIECKTRRRHTHRHKKTAEYSTLLLYYRMLFTSSATFVGAFAGVCTQMYACALRKVPLFHRECSLSSSSFTSLSSLSSSSSSFPSRCAITSLFLISYALLPLSLFYIHKTHVIIRTTRITEPQLHAGFAVAGAFTAEWLVQKEQSLQKEVDALVSERRERNKEFKQQK